MPKNVIFENQKPAKAVKKPRVISLNDFMNFGGRMYKPVGYRTYNPLRDDDEHEELIEHSKNYGQTYSNDINEGDKVWACDPVINKWKRGTVMAIAYEGFEHHLLYNVQFDGENHDIWSNQVNKAAIL